MAATLSTAVRNDTADYNTIAGFYQRHWCTHYHDGLWRMVDRLLLQGLPRGAAVLDVCCGTGTIARRLAQEGFLVTGIDASEEMLRFARENIPKGDFFAADVRAFRLPSQYAGALCTFDSLSYLLTLEDLTAAFRNVHGALLPGGSFLFDLSLEAAYLTEWGQKCTIMEEDEAHFLRGNYGPENRLGETWLTSFVRRDGIWTRSDTHLVARCHSPREVLGCLEAAGFASRRWYQSDEDPCLLSELGAKRACFLATKES